MGVAGVATPPPLIFKKKSGHPRGRCDIFSCYFIKQCVFVCVEWCCHWVLLYDRQKIGTAIVHYYFVLPGGAV